MPRTPSVTGMPPLRFGVIHNHASIVTRIDDACNLLFLLAQNSEPPCLIFDKPIPCAIYLPMTDEKKMTDPENSARTLKIVEDDWHLLKGDRSEHVPKPAQSAAPKTGVKFWPILQDLTQ
jgi:hypothetical protein